MVRSISVALTICYVAALVSCSKQASPPVQLNLITPWNAPDPFLEIAETVAKANSSSYMSYMGELADIKSSTLTPRQQYEQALAHAANYLDGPEELDIIKFSLSLHTTAPIIEAHHQYYNQTILSTVKTYNPSCDVWAQVGAHQACTIEELERLLKDGNVDMVGNQIEQETFELNQPSELEHWYCHPCENVTRVTLYTSSVNEEFAVFHNYLVRLVNTAGSIRYSIRYKPSSSHQYPLYLSGYGVELALKNTDYLVIDDRKNAATKEHQSQSQDGSTSFIKQQLDNLGKKVNQVLFDTEETSTIVPLTPDEIKSLGLKATQFVIASKDPLITLSQLTQDFPKYAHKISLMTLNEKLVNQVITNQQRFVKPGANALWINGRKLEDDETNPYFIARALQRERKLINTLTKLGGSQRQVIDVITSNFITSGQSSSMMDGLEGVYDVRDSKDEPAVIWWNDLEKDSRYKGWRPELGALLRPTYPGQMRAIGRNIYNVIMVEDLASRKHLQRLTNEIQNMVHHGTPIRFGLVPYLGGSNSPSSLAAKALHYLVQKYGKRRGMEFLQQIESELANANLEYATEDILSLAMKSVEYSVDKPISDMQLQSFKEQQDTHGVKQFLKRMGIGRLGKDEGILFLNGQYLEHNDEKPWTRVLMSALNTQTQLLARSVYMGEITDDDNVYDFFLNQPYVSPTRNAYVAVTENNPLLTLNFEQTDQVATDILYLRKDMDEPVTTNIWAIGNLNSPAGIKLILNALQFAETNNQTRLAIIHVPSQLPPTENKDVEFSDIVYYEMYINNIDMTALKSLFELRWQQLQQHTDQSQHIIKSMLPLAGSPIIEMDILEQARNKWKSLVNALGSDDNSKYRPYFSDEMNRHSGIIINGRILGPFADDDDFTVDDFNNLWQLENTQRIAPMLNALKHVNWPMNSTNMTPAGLIMDFTVLLEDDKKSASRNTLLGQEDVTIRERFYAQMDSDLTSTQVNKYGVNKNEAYVEIGVLLDPLSEDAQKWSTILNVLSELEGVTIDIHWNPIPQLEELPLKRFYRYVLDSEWQFSKDDQQQRNIPTAYFDDLPTEALYTLGVETIDPWHVTVKEANVDLDNIQLQTLATSDSHSSSKGQGVSAVYELERILVEGHCIDATDQHPPRGLQFTLGTDSHPAMTDTIVMANLGYFQLKAQPGIYQLGIRPGRSSQVYSIESIGTKGKWIKSSRQHNSTSTSRLLLTSFEGLRLFPTVKKNPGMETQDVLEDDTTGKQHQEKEGILSSLSSKLFGKKGKQVEDELIPMKKQAEINIFSVASGHLYERFLAIMMASVMEHTNSTVKFWFIENFLSPSFKDFVPELSKRYGFDYEMVTYKWPSWLNAQSEKQRTIWGYKILFLDVLFPLDLEKVIFVDADQIVRTDLKELVDLDLHGAPYGYTPFCSDRHEMDGFRFWSQGYWKEHLRGRPYHISALYVVDLVRFRQMAAGDRLRAQYQQLSVDPNSLANLDQDLPNNMIHIVPIFSLPQEWLWCETWCSDESLATAKTIDLCNNPLTKEPKLDRARRQVPEWETYDSQIEEIRQSFLQQQQQKDTTEYQHVNNENEKLDQTKSHHIKDEL
ncbi:UDP-glucose:glycoprotein glucosyltransferase-domain-containing protein [Halteromyces radiatus]|uniref:UDP-glucose:glycoprotein glucosyltransferase-domain-containing protein n=1 Tax=Halteromyces radiatus TaxID=101107 RepID=UPI0022203050|nr:UDP-glucose:glycoprotein glucosyltransferase-domain-containing protein [Halteromyces radiatus]KAI8096232.1 UDP-glucose:glycoprotein glucosyltransferase-domain-containing protein [Halteromyces radiatus]